MARFVCMDLFGSSFARQCERADTSSAVLATSTASCEAQSICSPTKATPDGSKASWTIAASF